MRGIDTAGEGDFAGKYTNRRDFGVKIDFFGPYYGAAAISRTGDPCGRPSAYPPHPPIAPITKP